MGKNCWIAALSSESFARHPIAWPHAFESADSFPKLASLTRWSSRFRVQDFVSLLPVALTFTIAADFSHLDASAVVLMKKLIHSNLPDSDAANLREIMGAVDRFEVRKFSPAQSKPAYSVAQQSGAPQKNFARLAEGQRKSKL